MIPYSAIRYTFLVLIVVLAVALFFAMIGFASPAVPSGEKQLDRSGMQATIDRNRDDEQKKRERDPQKEEPKRVDPQREQPQRQDPAPQRQQPQIDRTPAPQREVPRQDPQPQRQQPQIDRTPPQQRETPRQDPAPQRQQPKIDRPTPQQRETPRQDPLPQRQQPQIDRTIPQQREAPRQDPPKIDRTPSPQPDQPKRERVSPDRTPPPREQPRQDSPKIDRTPPDRRDTPSPDRTPRQVDRNNNDNSGSPRGSWDPSQPAPDRNRPNNGDVVRGGVNQKNVRNIDLDPKYAAKRDYPVYVERDTNHSSQNHDGKSAWKPRGPDATFKGNREHREYGVTQKYSHSYHSIENWCGTPDFYYNWHPRWHPSDSFGIYFYYSDYFLDADPGYTYMVYPGYYYWSPYRYYRSVPGYCYWSPAVVVDLDYSWPRYDNSYYGLDSGDSIDDVVRDLQDAWYNGDAGKLSGRLDRNDQVRIYFDQDYAYTLPSDDYYEMTLDTIATAQTDRLDFNTAKYLGRGMAFISGRQSYTDADGQAQTVYLSFTLRKEGGTWKIVAAGTSDDPIRTAPARW